MKTEQLEASYPTIILKASMQWMWPKLMFLCWPNQGQTCNGDFAEIDLVLFDTGCAQMSDSCAGRSSRHLGAVLRADGLAAGVH